MTKRADVLFTLPQCTVIGSTCNHDAGKPVTSLAVHVRTQEKALLVAGLNDGSSQALHVRFPNRCVY